MLDIQLRLPTAIDTINAPNTPLPLRTQNLINKIVEFVVDRERIFPYTYFDDVRKQEANKLAEQHEQVGLLALADQIRSRANLMIKPHYDENKRLRLEQKQLEEAVLQLIREKGRVRPNEICHAVRKSRGYMNKILSRLKGRGLVVIVAKKFYALPQEEK